MFFSISFFYEYLGIRIVVSFLLSFVLAWVDGVGISLFIPLLQLFSDESKNTEQGVYGLTEIFNSVGLKFNIENIILLMAVFFTLKGFVSYYFLKYDVKSRMLFVTRVRYRLLELLEGISYKYYTNIESGKILNTLSGEVSRVNLAYKAFADFLKSSTMAVVYIGLALLMNPTFSILVLLVGFVSSIFYRYIYTRSKRLSKILTDLSHKYQSELVQLTHNYKYLRTTNFLSNYVAKVKHRIRSIEKTNYQQGIYTSLVGASREPISILSLCAVIIVSRNYFEMSLNIILPSLLFLYRSISFVLVSQGAYNRFLNVSGSLEHLKIFNSELRLNIQAKNNSECQYVNFNVNSTLSLKGVGLTYGDSVILKDITLSIEPKTTSAFIGPSGSGKTTLINLITGFD